MKPNKEISALIEVIKAFLNDDEMSLSQETFKDVDWVKFEKAVNYHSIRPIVFDTLKKAKTSIPEDLKDRLEIFSFQQAISHLNNSVELKRILKTLKNSNIKVKSFKGVVYQNALYANSMRESGDIDLLIRPSDLEKTLDILLKDGYSFSVKTKGLPLNEFVTELLAAEEQYEFPLFKDSHHIDLHWDIHYGFLPYKTPKDFILNLENETKEIFWIMLNHHGGKEFWLKLKNVTDFALFVRINRERFDWASVLQKSEEFQMKTVLLNGFYLLRNIFHQPIPEVIERALKRHRYNALYQTFNYWNKSKLWSTPMPRFNYELILLKSQDIGFRRINYFKAIYTAYTKPNPIEARRFIDFPEKYHFLNFLSKVFSYLIKKTFGIK